MPDTRRLALTLEYDGTDFVGWQSQKNGRAVQDVLESAAGTLLQEKIRIVGAGRTDAGVHARGQVAHFDTVSRLEKDMIARGLNALLPEDVTVRSAEDVTGDFHARFSASSRAYSYTIFHRRVSLNRRYGWHIFQSLDANPIHEAVDLLVGTHDFTTLSKHSEETTHSWCHVFGAEWEEGDERSVFRIRANRFLYGMVRMTMGALLDIGRGKATVGEFRRCIESRERSNLFMLAPPYGLVLERVSYDRDEFETVRSIMERLRARDSATER